MVTSTHYSLLMTTELKKISKYLYQRKKMDVQWGTETEH